MTKLEKTLMRIDVTEFKNDYEVNLLSFNDLMDKYKESYRGIKNLIEYLKVTRDEKAVTLRHLKKVNDAKKNFFEELKESITYEELYNLYIVENRTHEEIRKIYGLTAWTLDKLFTHFKIKKDKKQAFENGIKTILNKYGSMENYNSIMTQNRKKTLIKKHGSLKNYKKHLSDKCKDTWNRTMSPKDIKLRNDKIRKTCRDRYNVDFPCQRKEARIGSNDSKINLLFAQILDDNNIKYEREFNLETFSYDFKIDDTLVELNPSATHNTCWNPFGKSHEPRIDKYYHRDKTLLANKYNYNCVHIFDWDSLEKVAQMFIVKEKVFARKCEIREVSKEDAIIFLNTYHLQNYANDSIRVGLYFKDELVSIMTFGKPRYNKNYEYELIRYASNKAVMGGAERLFKHFINTFSVTSVISYNDRAKFSGDVYTKLGFVENKRKSKPSKHWYNMKTKEHYTDNLIRQQGFSRIVNKMNYTEDISCDTNNNEELLIAHGFISIYDVGQITYTWTKK